MKKIIIWFLNRLALGAIAKKGKLSIGSNSKVQLRKIDFKDRCVLEIGHGCVVETAIIFERQNAQVKIGDRVFIGCSNLIAATNIDIGDDVLISWGCTIVDHNSHAISWNLRKNDVHAWSQGKKDWTHVESRSITISDKVWIGFNVIILKGVTIGEGAIVGAGSVVASDVAPYTIVAGNPARLIREIPADER
jgi:acetyltransferase-like isoleucine patch superfamily enzyme